MSNEEEDRRRFERVNLNKNLEIHDQGNVYETSLIDISLKGLLVEKVPSFSPNQNEDYTIMLPLDQEAQTSIEMTACLAHEEESKLGFFWKEIDQESFKHLRRLLLYNLGDQEELDRELSALIES